MVIKAVEQPDFDQEVVKYLRREQGLFCISCPRSQMLHVAYNLTYFVPVLLIWRNSIRELHSRSD